MDVIFEFIQQLFLGPNDPATVVECSANGTCQTIHAVVIALLVFVTLLTGFAYTTVLERKFIAALQSRVGPNRAGPNGLLQPVADGVKLIFKEDVSPTGADRVVYHIAPMLKVIPALTVLAVVPLGPKLTVPWFDGNWYRVNQGILDINEGVLWLLAITSLSVYGVTLAGWASANKYAILGSLRSTASMISYELSLGTLFAVPILLAGSMAIGDIVADQGGLNWYIFQNPLAAVLMFMVLMIEINRAPFDLPEAEQELVAGHMTEYSGMKFAMFFMAEYINMIGISVIFATMFLGGYDDGLGLVAGFPLLGVPVLATKVIALLVLQIWIRGTIFRPRYDRLMTFGWKVLLPVSIFSVAWTAITVTLAEEGGGQWVYVLSSLILGVVVLGFFGLMAREITPKTAPTPDYNPAYRGPGTIALEAVGALLAIPASLIGGDRRPSGGTGGSTPQNK
jgi:NADH-quinone oxidoreductase subunit H